MLNIMQFEKCPICNDEGTYEVNADSESGKNIFEEEKRRKGLKEPLIVDYYTEHNSIDKKKIDVILVVKCRLCKGDFKNKKSRYVSPSQFVEFFKGGSIYAEVPIAYVNGMHSIYCQNIQPIIYDNIFMRVPTRTPSHKLESGIVNVKFVDLMRTPTGEIVEVNYD